MKARELENLGIPRGPAIKLALELCGEAARNGHAKKYIRQRLAAVVADPDDHVDDTDFGALAQALVLRSRSAPPMAERTEPAPYRQWGDDLDANAVEQMTSACRLPVAVAGALMPDAHLGYGLPIGGVLATDNAVIPYGVGVDIACRMKLSVFDMPAGAIGGQTGRLRNVLERETRFGIGARFERPLDHDVMDADWTVSPITSLHKDKAHQQLGTSGSGNHFVEFGVLTLEREELGLDAGTYLALLSHSGSRGTGASVADHYSKLAIELHPELPKPLRHLAWLDLGGEPGHEYWAAMNLMGAYASANHSMIHRQIARALGAEVIAGVENHHNFAWRETHAHVNGGRSVVVHRKGATPAGDGVLGVIPGSMASPAYVVRGRGVAASLESASHGAGRVMSRTVAKRSFTWSGVKKLLEERGVTLLSAGIDEVPGVYKDIDQVMAQQHDLVEKIARFDPKIVKMAPAGERPED